MVVFSSSVLWAVVMGFSFGCPGRLVGGVTVPWGGHVCGQTRGWGPVPAGGCGGPDRGRGGQAVGRGMARQVAACSLAKPRA